MQKHGRAALKNHQIEFPTIHRSHGEDTMTKHTYDKEIRAAFRSLRNP